MKSELNHMGRNLSQIDEDGLLLPKWPHASHFRKWEYSPLEVEGKEVDLYWTLNKGDLLIGIQTSDEDGNYMSPHICTDNTLHSSYKDRPDVVRAYKIACKDLEIEPKFWVDKR